MIRTVMVVEDDDAIRMVLRTNLEDEGYRVLEATTAEQGLLIVQDEQPDVVLVDLRLPGIHGLDLVRSLPDSAHCFLIKHGAHSVVARLNLTGEKDLLTILSGRERTVRLLDELRQQRGDDPALWLNDLLERA